MRTLMLIVEILGVSIWTGGVVCLGVVARASLEHVDEASRVRLMKSLGKTYKWLGMTSLCLSLACGVALTWPPTTWSAFKVVTALVALLLLLSSVAAMREATGISRLRSFAATGASDVTVSREFEKKAAVASAVRGLMGVLSVGLVVMGVIGATH